jgi:hypothetical protein
MENKEIVLEVLKKYGVCTAKQVVQLARRDYNAELTPAKVSGALRPMTAKGKIATSKDVKGTTVYWIAEN